MPIPVTGDMAGRTRFPRPLGVLLALAAIALAIAWRFSPWMHQYFYGDDLGYLMEVHGGTCATHASEILTEACKERFRPVASGFVLAMIDLFAARMKYYNIVNLLLVFANAALVFACARRLSGGRLLVSAMIALAVATSRFALFDATQAIGPVETLPFAAALGCIYCVLRFDEASTKPLRWAIGALVATFVAINAHERFVVLAAWLALALLTSPRARNLSRYALAALFLACAALPAIYIGYKTLVLHTTFLIGTSETHLQPDIGQVLRFASDAGWSLAGFNRGPAYLVGWQPEIGFNPATTLGIVFIASWVALLLLGARQALRNRGTGFLARIEPVRWPVLLAILAAFVLFPALLTIRLEHRWLLAPFTFLLLIGAWGAGLAPARRHRLATACACLLGLSSMAIDSLVMRGYDQVFLIDSAHFATLAKRDILDAAPDARGPIRLVADDSHCTWTLIYGTFFGIYGPATRPVQCYDSLNAAIGDGLPPGVALYAYDRAGDRLVDLTDQADALSGGGGNQSVAYDFLSEFGGGKIDDARRVDTPTGQGVLVLPWDSTLGRRETLIVLSGFTYRYEDVAVPTGAHLRFGVGMLYPAPQPARLVVTATSASGAARTLLSLDLVAPAPGQSADFKLQSIDLADLAGQTITFAFGVQSPGGDSTAHWVGLVNPALVQPSPPPP